MGWRTQEGNWVRLSKSNAQAAQSVDIHGKMKLLYMDPQSEPAQILTVLGMG